MRDPDKAAEKSHFGIVWVRLSPGSHTATPLLRVFSFPSVFIVGGFLRPTSSAAPRAMAALLVSQWEPRAAPRKNTASEPPK